MEFSQLKLTIENTRLEQEEIVKRNLPTIGSPRRLLPGPGDNVYIPPPSSHLRCRMHNCFDYSRCSLTSQFPVYIYNPDEYSFSQATLEAFIKLSVTHAFDASLHMTYDAHIACVYVVLVGDVEGGLRNTTGGPAALENKLAGLPHWNGDGRNHVLLNIARYYSNRDVFDGVNTGRAMVVQSAFTDVQFRESFDIVIPPSLGVSYGDVWDQLSPVVPARKKYLMSHQGELQLPSFLAQKSKNKVTKSGTRSGSANSHHREIEQLIALDNAVVETVKTMESQFPGDNFHCEFMCDVEKISGYNGEWSLCGPDSARQDLLKLSTFTLIIAPTNYSIVSTTLTQVRILLPIVSMHMYYFHTTYP